jgi:hypothetical protein
MVSWESVLLVITPFFSSSMLEAEELRIQGLLMWLVPIPIARIALYRKKYNEGEILKKKRHPAIPSSKEK